MACARFLKAQKWQKVDQIIAYGQSAGGLVVGAAINIAPDLFECAILDYPYLDVVNTMIDPGLPLTTLEYKEWGNPQQQKDFETIMAYSPYQNIKSQAYPPIIVFAGAQDFQTPTWQVLSSVARLRKANLSESKVLVKVGKGGHVGTYPNGLRIKELLYQYLFMEEYLD